MLKRRVALLGVLAVVAASAMAACGASKPSQAEIAQDRARLTKALAAEVNRRAEISARSEIAKCRAQLGRALALLTEPPQQWRQSGGLVPRAVYEARVEAISAEISRVPRASLSEECLGVDQALAAAEAAHLAAVSAWSDCLVTDGPFCDNVVDLCAYGRHIALCDVSASDSASFIGMKITANQLRGDWETARERVKTAETLITDIGRPTPLTMTVPRSDATVGASVFGMALASMCRAGDAQPSDTADACTKLRDVLAAGVKPDEDADLNDAVTDLLSAYGIDTASPS